MAIKSKREKLTNIAKHYEDNYDCTLMVVILLSVIVISIISGMGIQFIVKFGIPIFLIWGIAIITTIVIDEL